MVTAFRRIALLTASFLVLAGPWPNAQTGAAGQARPNPQAPSGLTFRVESNYVEVDAVVTDAAGSFVRDLKAADFDVREDSHPQNVDVFSLVDIPFERVDRPANRPVDVDPDVSTNTKEFNGRVYLIVLDGFHVAAAHTAQVKRQAKQFIEQSLAANDLAAVVQVGDAAASQEFTSSRATLLAAVDRFVGRKLPSSVLNLIADAKAKEGRMAEASPPRDPDVAARAAQAKQALDSIARLSDYMAGIRGRRKAVLLFSEGIDFNTDDVLGPAPSPAADIRSSMESREAPEVLDSEQQMIGAATRGNVSLYTVDPRGIAGPDDITILSTGMPGASDGAPPQPVTADVQAEILRGQTTLRVFAEQTGGLAHTGSNDFTGAFAKIVQDNSSYYVLGYYAATTKRDGKFHDITVKVRRPGVQVRARKGYYAPKANAIVPQPDVMRDLLQSPMPMAGLPMRLVAQVTKGTAGKAHVYLTVEVEGHDLPLEERAGAFVNKLEFSYAAFDLDAQRQASGSKAIDLNFNAQSRKAVADGGLRVTTQFDIAPGRYQLRLAGHEALGNTSGSVFRDLEVPDFAKPPLAMSDLIVTSSSAGSWPTTTDATMLKDLLPGPVTAERAFALEATMVAYAEVYDNDLAHPHDVDFTATVRTHDGDQVFVTRDAKKSTDATPERGYAFMPRIPLADLVPGRYLLTVEAKSSAGGAVTKEIPFSIK